jgi:fumarate hydratase subunit beta
MNERRLTLPIEKETLLNLKAGDRVFLTGVIYTARDAAHKRIVEELEKHTFGLFPLEGAIIYYCGPSPAPPGRVIGSAGPTTSYRMDPYVPILLQHGVYGFIGKGKRGEEVRNALRKYGGVYFIATGGAGAILSTKIVRSTIVGYEDLGPEAIYALHVVDFPVIVGIDAEGNDIYELGPQNFKTGISQLNT